MLVIAGGGLLGYVAGEMAVTDTAWQPGSTRTPTGCTGRCRSRASLLVIGVARLAAGAPRGRAAGAACRRGRRASSPGRRAPSGGPTRLQRASRTLAPGQLPAMLAASMNDRVASTSPACRIRGWCARTTRTRCSSTATPASRCSPTAWAATTPARSRAASPSTSCRAGMMPELALRPRAVEGRRAERPHARARCCCSSRSPSANKGIYEAAQARPECAGHGHDDRRGRVLRQPRLDRPHRRLALLPAARREVRAAHARPLAAAGADRQRRSSRRSRRVTRSTRTS